jgi:hypothetical protein
VRGYAKGNERLGGERMTLENSAGEDSTVGKCAGFAGEEVEDGRCGGRA